MSDTSAWFRPLRWREVPGGNTVLLLTADPDERSALAKQLESQGIGQLEAKLSLSPWFDGVEISGELRAVVTRLCGVSLEPYDEIVDEPFQLRIVPSNSPHVPKPTHGEVELDIDADDPPDVAEADIVDLGSYLVEHLMLSLSPFPRKPDAVFEPPVSAGVISPFAILARLKTDT